MSDKYLLMWLEGPLQSWGDDSRYGRRESLPFPTKSGVFGLICAARGAGGTQEDWLSEHRNVEMTVLAFSRNEKDQSTKQLRDFHTVGNGYDDTDPFQLLFIPKTSEGKAAVGGGTKITYRYYLQEACFAVVLKMDAGQCSSIAKAIQQPVWFTSLGRKNCVPSEWLYQGEFDSSEEAFNRASDLAKDKNRFLSVLVKEGAYPDEGRVQTVNDVPICFGDEKKYAERYVTVISEIC